MYFGYDKDGRQASAVGLEEYDFAKEEAGEDGFIVGNTIHFQRKRDVTTLYAANDEGTATLEVVFNDNPMIFLSVNNRSTVCLRIIEAKHLRNMLDAKIAEAEKIHAEYVKYYEEDA